MKASIPEERYTMPAIVVDSGNQSEWYWLYELRIFFSLVMVKVNNLVYFSEDCCFFIGPWEIRLLFCIIFMHMLVIDSLGIFCDLLQVNATEPYWWKINIDWGITLVCDLENPLITCVCICPF